ncbi:MAG: hypothetical protein MZU91_10855 [Desulfosudis oleivorans]|nr:hypothetical protein [Desulfosudis oleivorans]
MRAPEAEAAAWKPRLRHHHGFCEVRRPMDRGRDAGPGRAGPGGHRRHARPPADRPGDRRPPGPDQCRDQHRPVPDADRPGRLRQSPHERDRTRHERLQIPLGDPERRVRLHERRALRPQRRSGGTAAGLEEDAGPRAQDRLTRGWGPHAARSGT